MQSDNLKITTALAKLISSNLVGQIIPFLLMPIIYRLYDKEVIGTFTVIMSMFSIFTIVASGKLEQAILIIRSPKLRTIFITKILTVYLLTSLICTIAFAYINQIKVENEIQFYSAIFLWLFLHATNLIVYQNMVAGALYTKYAIHKIIFVTFLMLMQIGLGYLNNTHHSIIAAYILSNLLMVAMNIKSLNIGKYGLLIKKNIFTYRRLRDFPIYTMPQSLFNAFANDVPIYAILFYLNASLLADYNLATQIVIVPLGLLSAAGSQVLYQKLTENSKNKARFHKVYKMFLFGTVASGCIIIIAYYALAELIIIKIFGNDWASAVPIVGLISIMGSVRAIGSVLSVIVWVLNKQRTSFMIEILTFPLRLLALVYYSDSNSLYDMLYGYVIISIIITTIKISWYLKIERTLCVK